jgi:hypothetical protein
MVMNKGFLLTMLFLPYFFSLHAQNQNILVGKITYIGDETMKYTEYSEKNTHTIVVYDRMSKAQKNELQRDIEALFPADQVTITEQPGAVIISLLINQDEYSVKSQLQDTIDGKKRLTISIYQVSVIRMLEQMTKKPILEYAKGKKMLSEIA